MMDAVQGEGCEYPLVIAGGAATFALVNIVSGHLAPQSACNTLQQKWKWRNVATSLIHSIITGTWALAAFYKVSIETSKKKTLFNSFFYIYRHLS